MAFEDHLNNVGKGKVSMILVGTVLNRSCVSTPKIDS